MPQEWNAALRELSLRNSSAQCGMAPSAVSTHLRSAHSCTVQCCSASGHLRFVPMLLLLLLLLLPSLWCRPGCYPCGRRKTSPEVPPVTRKSEEDAARLSPYPHLNAKQRVTTVRFCSNGDMVRVHMGESSSRVGASHIRTVG